MTPPQRHTYNAAALLSRGSYAPCEEGESRSRMEARLIPIMGYEGQPEVALSPEKPLLIGRGQSADVQLLHSRVSRLHCRISFESGFYVVDDLGSRNGTWVNGRRVHRAILFHHDRVTVGSAEFRFMLRPESALPAAAATPESERGTTFQTTISGTVRADDDSTLFLAIPQGMDAELAAELERDLSAVCRVISSVNAEPHLDRLLETIMDSVMDVTNADRGYLMTAREGDGTLQPVVSRNKPDLPEGVRNSFSRTVAGDCYGQRCAVLMADPAHHEGLSDSAVAQQIQSIVCVPMCDRRGPVGVIYVDRLAGSEPFTERDLKVITAISNQAGIAIRRAQLAKQAESLFRDAVRTVIKLIEVKDEYTYGHSERVTAVSLLIGDLCAVGRTARRNLEVAGLLHDVGKVGVDAGILQKAQPLTDQEYALLQEHPAKGSAVLEEIQSAREIADAVRHHHERWDGGGYPDGLAGEEIGPLAQILALADAFDSMASDRPYKKALSRREVVDEIRTCSGTQFGPEIAERFVSALEGDETFQRRIGMVYRRRSR